MAFAVSADDVAKTTIVTVSKCEVEFYMDECIATPSAFIVKNQPNNPFTGPELNVIYYIIYDIVFCI